MRLILVMLNGTFSKNYVLSFWIIWVQITAFFFVMLKFFYIRCCAQILNLVVQLGFDLIMLTISKLLSGVKYVKHATISKKVKFRRLKEILSWLSIRSNLIYDMLVVALRYKVAFLYLCERGSNSMYKEINK